jgi:heme-degrading monooxygenase HmoA
VTGFLYLWVYEVREGCEVDFEKLYGPHGDWARFFQQSKDYRGTDLLRDGEQERRYLTIDRWASRESHRAFVAAHRDEFAELDGRGERLTKSEVSIGSFEGVPPGDSSWTKR